MPKTEEQYKEIREERRKQIMQTALELFADNGYHSTSMAMIAKRAKISKGLIYNYFNSKEELLQTIITEFAHKSFQYFDPNHDGVLTDQEFIYYIEQNFEQVKQNPQEWKLYSAIAFQPSAVKALDKTMDKTGNDIMKILYNFFKDRNCKDPQAEIMFFSALMKGAIIQYISAPEFFPIDLLKNKIIDHYKQKLIKL